MLVIEILQYGPPTIGFPPLRVGHHFGSMDREYRILEISRDVSGRTGLMALCEDLNNRQRQMTIPLYQLYEMLVSGALSLYRGGVAQ